MKLSHPEKPARAPVKNNVFNRKAASLMRDCAELLRQQDANPFRINAYIRAAQTLESLPRDARDILRDDSLRQVRRGEDRSEDQVFHAHAPFSRSSDGAGGRAQRRRR